MTESEAELTTDEVQAILIRQVNHWRESLLRVSLVGKGNKRARERLHSLHKTNTERNVRSPAKRDGFIDRKL